MSHNKVSSNNLVYLPIELVHYILSFAPIVSPSSNCIKRLIDVYERDHSWLLTTGARMYYVKNIIPLCEYYWLSRNEPDEFDLGPSEYNSF
jgi:hypothetical protein